MGNYSNDPQVALQAAVSSGYSRVRFQQGKPILDRELNLLADLASPERLAQQCIGDGVPSGSQGFQITGLNVAGGDFNILQGVCRVAGREVVLGNQTTYKSQPNKGQVAALPAGGSNVYLHVFTDEVTSAQDPDLANSGDVSVETSIRLRNDWEVIVSVVAISDSDHFLLAVINTTANTIVDSRRTDLTLSVVKDQLDAVKGEIAGARGSAAVLTDRLNKNLAADGTILPGTVSIQKMASTLVFNGQISVPAAPAAGQTTVQSINVFSADDTTFLMISVHFDGPRATGLTIIPISQFFAWQHQVVLVKPAASMTFTQHLHQVLIQNPNLFPISVTCKAYRLAEV